MSAIIKRGSIKSMALGSVILSIGVSGTAFGRLIELKQEEAPTNVLFFFVDDLRPNLGCYGDEKAVTPHIDQLAQNGVLFTRAFCQMAVCNPSRTSLLTGLRPDENGVVDLETHFRDKVPEVTTLPQLFKANGYLTLGVGKIYHSTPFIIDDLSWSRPVPEYLPRAYLLPENLVENAKQNSYESATADDSAYPDGKIADEAIRYLEEAGKTGKPFFIAVGFTKPHLPFCAPKKYWDIYQNTPFSVNNSERPLGSPDLAFHNWEELRGYRDIPKSGPLTQEKVRKLWQGYYACISYMDAQVGRILETLERLGLKERTIIVLWGDNGFHLGEQDIWGKSTNFELDARIPLIIAAPGMKGNGSVTDAIVESVDVYPTLADLCRLVPADKLSGISLKPLLINPGKKWKNIAYHQFIRPYDALRLGKPSHMGYSVRTPAWRCTCWWDLSTGELVEKELYNLSDNPIETKNLAGTEKYLKTENELTARVIAYKNKQYIQH